MSKVQRRKTRRVHVSKGRRKDLRKYLFERDGNLCCWCNKPMIDIYKCTDENIEDAATIEHHFAVEWGRPQDIKLFKLAHKRCNK